MEQARRQIMRRVSAAKRTIVSVVTAFSLLVLLAGCSSQDSAISQEGAVTIFGDGAIGCPNHVADDDSLPVGTVTFEPGIGEVKVTVVLTDAAPDSRYYVEVWSDESCVVGEPLGGYDTPAPEFDTDGEGTGELDFVVPGLEPGTYRLNVDVVIMGEFEDLRHREMGAAEFTEVVVESDDGV
jgi:hypothetical protein